MSKRPVRLLEEKREYDMDLEFYICPVCGKLHVMPEGMGCYPCCGRFPEKISVVTGGEGSEKHVPVFTFMREGCTLTVGAVEHPMTEDHYITHIILLTEQGYWAEGLCPGAAPTASFSVPDGDRVVRAYAHCNKHGMWVNYSPNRDEILF